jgi:type IV secretion system protein VirB6
MITRFALLFLLLLSLVGCNGERCIDPDDFGNPTFTISARYKTEELEGSVPNQVAPWRDYGFKVNGRPLTIVVKNWNRSIDKNNANELSAWSSWFGTNKNTNSLATLIERMQSCNFANNTMCPTNGSEAVILNAPCLFKKGVGLYALVSEPGIDPNSSKESKNFPQGIAFHVGEPQSGYSLYSTNKKGDLEQAGGIVFNYIVPSGSPQQTLKEQYLEAPLYFKIIDRDYTDNSGQYKVTIKSGVESSSEDPLSLITRLVKEKLFGSGTSDGVVKNLYQGITDKQPAYKTVVRASLIIYIIFSAFSFLIGSLKITNAELISRMIKVVIVSILLTSNVSLYFFNEYLLVVFTTGVFAITQMISNAVSGGGWGKLPLLQIMIAPQTLSKLFSLLFTTFDGWIFIIIYFCLLFFVLIITVKATIIYLTALIAIGVLIVMGPIFICFLLFDVTKSLFDNWIKLLISYSLQPIILFAGMGLLTLLILQEIYATLGFRVCRQSMFNFGPISNIISGYEENFGDGSDSTSLFYFWFPQPRDFSELNTTLSSIPVPYDHFDANGKFCQAYECNELRVPDLPYLDPTSDRDKERIDNFKAGKIVDYKNLLIFLISIYLLHKFNSLTLSIAQFLSNSSGNLTSLGNAGASAYTPIANYTKNLINSRLLNPAWKVIRNSPLGAPLRLASRIASRTATRAMEALYQKELEDSTLMPSQVRKLAEDKSGIKYSNLNMTEYKNYKNTLKELFSQAGVQGYSASDIAKLDFKDIEKQLSLTKFKKDISLLNDREKLELKSLIENTEAKLGKTIATARQGFKEIDTFQKAYMEAHIELTNQGMGFFKKRSTTINSLHNLSEKYKSFKGKNKQEKLEERLKKTERFYKMYDDFLGKIIDGKLGNDFNYYDYEDPRMLTYGEKVVEKELAKNSQRISKEIDVSSLKEGHDIIRPEFIAQLELTSNSDNALYYQELANENISQSVYNTLISNNNGTPILRGRRYMAERMTDKEFKESIDNAYNLKEELINNDPYLSDNEFYKEQLKNSEKEYFEALSTLEDKKLRDDLTSKIDNGYINEDELNATLKDDKYEVLRKNIKDYQLSKATIAKLIEREQAIADEVGMYINEMNSFRKKANLDPYKPYYQ